MHRLLSAVLLGAGLLAATAAHADDEALRAAIAGPQRSPANVLRDGARHPYETLTFFGIRPDMKVIELVPEGGWYTEILAPYLSANGMYVAAGNDPDSKDEKTRAAAARLVDKLHSNPAFSKAVVGVFEPPLRYKFGVDGGADMILTFRNVHNWLKYDDPQVKILFAALYSALKPGGVLGIEEHRLPEKMRQDATASTGYVHESYVIRLAQEAGFKLVAKSEINANPADNAQHEGGVWALPPTYKNKDVDRAKYSAIGESDRMTLKFVK